MSKKQRCMGSLLMILVLLFSMFPVTVGAAGEVWIDISNAAGLISISSNPSANYRLKADIDLVGTEWNPIATFSGKLDGNSKVIRNFTINNTSTSNKGLFSSITASGQVSNLGIEGANITAGNYTGILTGDNSGLISRCYTKGSVSGYEYVGGLVGQNSGTIENSFTQASVSGKDYLGGLAGANSGTVEKSYAASSVLPSVFNNYLDFNGTSGYIDIGHKDIYVGDKFTLEAWFQWDKTNTDAVNFIMGKGYEQFEIHTGGGSGVNGLRFIPIWNESGDSWIDVKNVIQPGWFHVAAVYDYNSISHLATAQVYINGKAQDLWRGATNLGKSATLVRSTNTLGCDKVGDSFVPKQNNINIGRRTDNTFYFDGKICDVRFWNTARTGDEINRDKDRILTGNEPGLVGYWKLNEASGDALDSSSTYNNGTLVGGVTRTSEIAATNKGGLIGQNTGTVSDSYYDAEVSGLSDSTGITKSTAEMKLQSTFTDWDFSNVWGVDSGKNAGYPYLLPIVYEMSNATVIMTAPAAGGNPQTAANVDVLTGRTDYTVSNIVWNEQMTTNNRFKAGQVYTATITLTSKNSNKFQTAAFTPVVAGSASVGPTVTSGTGVGNTVTFMVTFPATSAKTVTGITVSTQPTKLIYTEGKDNALSLDGMVITETYNDGTQGTVSFAEGMADGYTTSPANGSILSASINSVIVTNTASGCTALTNKITVGSLAGSTVNLSEWTGSNTIIVPAGATTTITGSRSNIKIFCGARVSLTLNNVTITNTTALYSPVTFTGKGNTLTITGINRLNAGGDAAGVTTTGAELNICGEGKLTAVGGYGSGGSAGIGGSETTDGGSITISGGTIIANGGSGRKSRYKEGVGICAERTVIAGGMVTANGYSIGAGIGGGHGAAGSSITILGGIVEATGNIGAPGIGGYGGVKYNSTITISGGKVIATGGTDGYLFGAGIGSTGLLNDSGSVIITGGEVFAKCKDNTPKNTIHDIGNNGRSGTWNLSIAGTAKVFLQNGKSVSPNTTTHSLKTNLTTDDVYGITLPGGWTTPFGAYLLKPAPTNNNVTAPVVPTQLSDNAVEILVNGKTETAATATTTQQGNQTVTTITVDDKKIDEKLQAEGNNATVTIPVNNADVVVGQLSGQTVKNMEARDAVLEIKTENITYTLPASQINIDNVSEQIGQNVELKDIKVNVTISSPPQDTVKIVEDTADRNNYKVVIKPVEFNITCSSGNKTVEVSKFNGYVERLVAIPEGIDPSKITTGIVLNSDGTFSHVPTVITKIDSKYYAKINSLTNSTYSVIWSPKTFKDVENYWAKDAVNDMASRLVISGVGNDMFAPDRDITRAEFSAIIVRALGLMHPGTGKTSFGDVSKNDWYYDAVSIAYEYGIISGYGNGKFGPTDKITHEQAMIMVAKAMKITKLKADFKIGEAEQLIASYGDFKKASSWAKDSIALCVKTGVVPDGSGKIAAPKDYITGAEVAVMVQKLLQKSNLI